MAIAELIMPKMGESIVEATILKWHKQVGDHVRLDETVLDIATDKVDSEIPSPVEGKLIEILYPVNNVVAVGSVIAKFETDVTVHSPIATVKQIQPEPITQQPVFVSSPTKEVVASVAPLTTVHHSLADDIPFQPYASQNVGTNNRFFSPLVLNIANSEGISLSELERITGTGADGRVSKKDIVQYIADKRAGKVASFTATPQITQLHQQAPIHEYQQPSIVIPTPIQEVVMQKAVDVPTYIPPQPIVVEKPLVYPQPIVEAPIQQPIVEAIKHEFDQPVYHPIVEPVSTHTHVTQPVVEVNQYQQSEPVHTPIEHPIVEPVVHQTYVSQPIVEAITQQYAEPVYAHVHQPIVEPIAHQTYVTQPIVEAIPQQYTEPVYAPVQQPIVEPVPYTATSVGPLLSPINLAPPHQDTEVVVSAPLIQPAPQQYVETVTPSAQPIITMPTVENVLPTSVVSETKEDQAFVQTAEPVITPQPIIEEFIAPVVEPIKESLFTKTAVTEAAPLNLQPVYMVPPPNPTIPLVTLAEGGSGKYTSPNSTHPSGNVEIIEMDRMRKLISKHMVDSKNTSAHVTSFTEADVTNMVIWRERVKGDFERREGTKLTFTPMFIDCIVQVLKRFPLLNASVEGDKIIIKKDLNIGMATALPSGNLIVPVIKGADQLNIVGLSSAVNKLAADARNNQLKPDDVMGGTFTFTNVGTFGTLMGTPIINQPQVAILAAGMIKKRPVVIESPNNDTIGIRHMMYLSLSYDHRIIDGSMGAGFLTAVAKEFESWDLNRTWYHYL